MRRRPAYLRRGGTGVRGRGAGQARTRQTTHEWEEETQTKRKNDEKFGTADTFLRPAAAAARMLRNCINGIPGCFAGACLRDSFFFPKKWPTPAKYSMGNKPHANLPTTNCYIVLLRAHVRVSFIKRFPSAGHINSASTTAGVARTRVPKLHNRNAGGHKILLRVWIIRTKYFKITVGFMARSDCAFFFFFIIIITTIWKIWNNLRRNFGRERLIRPLKHLHTYM